MDSLITFDIEGLKILGAFKKDIHIQGFVYDDDNGSDNLCVLVIARDLFFKIFNQWLKHKKSLCELWNHYCGVSSVYIDKYKFVGEAYLNTPNLEVDVDAEDSIIRIDVPMYEVIKCSIDMEHG